MRTTILLDDALLREAKLRAAEQGIKISHFFDSIRMEGRFGFHGKPPSQEQAEQAMEELERTYQEQTKALEGRG